jgi:hypothetical protein
MIDIKMSTGRVIFAARQKFRTILLGLFRRYMHKKLLKWKHGAEYFKKRQKSAKVIYEKLKIIN